jgi:hypothetical protein
MATPYISPEGCKSLGEARYVINSVAKRGLMSRIIIWQGPNHGYNEFMSSGSFSHRLDAYAQMLSCPDPFVLDEFRMQPDAPEFAALQAHLAGCPLCQKSLTALATTPERPLSDESRFETVAPSSQPLALSLPPLAVGQIWSTQAQLLLARVGLPELQSDPIEASFARLFVIAAVGVRHLGRYLELSLCPINDFTELASEHDFFLEPEDTPFEESLLLEAGAITPALAQHLDQYHGEVSPRVLTAIQTLLQQQVPSLRRGGTILSPEGPHARFQRLEASQLAYLAIPLQALAQLKRSAARALVAITPKGLLLPPAPPQHPLLALWQPQASDRTLAAASEAISAESPVSAVTTLRLTPQVLVDLWVEGAHLEIYAHTPEQLPVSNLRISYPDSAGQLQQVATDGLGTAFVALDTLANGEVLLGFALPESTLEQFLPVQLQP